MEILNINLAAMDKTNEYIGQNRDVSYTMQSHEPWIRYGCNNDLPYFLSDISQRSPTLAAINLLKTILTAGDGFQFDEKNIALKDFIENNNLNQLFETCAEERVLYNANSLEVIYDDYGQVAAINNITIPSLRVQNAPIPEVYYFSRDWRQIHNFMYQPFTLPVYNPAKAGEQKIQVMHDYRTKPNNFYYGVEDYRSALTFCQAEINLGIHWFSTTSNGMLPSGVWVMSEDMTPEELLKFKKDMKSNHQGANNAGSVIYINFKGTFEPKFVPFDNKQNAGDIYDSLNANVTQKIISSCNLLNPSLAGLPSAGGFNMTDQLSSSLEYFYNIIIPRYQKPLLNMFARLFKQNGLIKSFDEIKIKKKKALPYYFDSNILLSIFSKNELRADAGYPFYNMPEQPTQGDGLGNSPIQTQQPAPTQQPTNSAPVGPTNNKLRYKY